ncbi:MAG: alpha-L-arabinofuranosidase C-terminal domain-containing protein [Parabacteroides sp.]
MPENGGGLVTFAPDSVYLCAWSQSDSKNRGGLQFAWSSDRHHWKNVGNGSIYLYSDYGNWGNEKRMYHPQICQDETGTWHAYWQVNERDNVLAHTTSEDLIHWTPQSYYPQGEQSNRFPAYPYTAPAEPIELEGTLVKGNIRSVPLATLEQLQQHAAQEAFRQQLFSERCEQDSIRFVGLAPIQATLRIRPSDAKAISPELMGIFFEDINYAADGGLYAELIQNRDFEYTPRDKQGQDPDWHSLYAWELRPLKGTSLAENSLIIDSVQPLHPNNPHYACWQVLEPAKSAIVNVGYDGICVKKGEHYDFSLFGCLRKGKKGTLRVCLMTADGQTIGESRLTLTGKVWKQLQTELTATADAENALLYLIPEDAVTYALDMISLFPRNTFKRRKNGLRADLAQTLADLHPRFVRFPGGCVAHGDGLDNIYRWKQTIGPLESRKPMRNLWNYHQSMGLGYFEYFQFCEDIGAEPVPVLAAGVPCQNSSDGGAGQQGGIPLCDMEEYIQDILDLIEYANGDPTTSEWAKRRAEAGHPEPFHLKYIGIGNEDLISEVFTERFTMIYNAIRTAYPDITVIGTVGPFNEGSDYEAGWKLADQLQIPIVDEHYYQTPGWFLHNQHFYDSYDRTRSKVYLGEYASHLPGRPNNIETALSEALYLTHVERNGDVVHMSSYAPLLAKEGHTQWNPDLIYFNNREVKPTVGYYVQQLYSQHSGTEYIGNRLTIESEREDVKLRVASSVVRDAQTGDLIVKLVNMLPVAVTTQIQLTGIETLQPTTRRIVLQGTPTDKTARPQEETLSVSPDFACPLPPYSFTVLRLSSTAPLVHE